MTRQMSRILCVFFVGFMLNLGVTGARTIHEITSDLSTNVTNFDVIEKIPGNMRHQQQDTSLTSSKYRHIYGASESDNLHTLSRQTRKAIKKLSRRWTSHQIPYSIQSLVFSSSEMDEINKAIEEWEVNTCITFRRATSADDNYLIFDDGSGCSSKVGMIGGKQTIRLAKGCRSKKSIAHEIGHAVGFYHEQSRPDRDDFVNILEEYIKDANKRNFRKLHWSEVSTYNISYDYTSLMHYGRKYFSINKKNDTIVTKNSTFQNHIGLNSGLSFSDIKLANLMYNCSKDCRSHVICPEGGFIGKNCQCWCPGSPAKVCDGTNKETQHPFVTTTVRTVVRLTMARCVDLSKKCPYWGKKGYCSRKHTAYMKMNCAVTCGHCKGNVNSSEV